MEVRPRGGLVTALSVAALLNVPENKKNYRNPKLKREFSLIPQRLELPLQLDAVAAEREQLREAGPDLQESQQQ